MQRDSVSLEELGTTIVDKELVVRVTAQSTRQQYARSINTAITNTTQSTRGQCVGAGNNHRAQEATEATHKGALEVEH